MTPSVEDTVYDPREQGKQTPIDHVDKIPLPSQSRLCIVQDDHHDNVSTAIVEPILMHDLSFCHSSKQTTILADVGVD